MTIETREQKKARLHQELNEARDLLVRSQRLSPHTAHLYQEKTRRLQRQLEKLAKEDKTDD